MEKKTLTKEELIARLKEISEDKPKERELCVEIMCYSIAAPPIKHAKCELCGARIEYADWGNRESIYEIVGEIADLGYDVKVETCCMDCAQRWINVLYPNDTMESDCDGNHYRTPYVEEINYLFSFRLKDEGKYHLCIANEANQYKALHSLLSNKTFYTDYHRERHYIADEKDLLEYMTGINFDEQD